MTTDLETPPLRPLAAGCGVDGLDTFALAFSVRSRSRVGLGVAGGFREGELWRKLLLGLEGGAQVTFVLAQRHMGGREELIVESRL